MQPVYLGTRYFGKAWAKTAIVQLEGDEIPADGYMPEPKVLAQACDMMEIQPARVTKDLVIEPSVGHIERDLRGVLLVIHQIATIPQED